MTILAQEWLRGGPGKITSPYDGDLRKMLELPSKFDKKLKPADLDRLAERIVFSEDVPTLLYSMHKNHQLTYTGIVNSARLPYDCFWVEWKSTIDNNKEPNHYGALVHQVDGTVTMYLVIGIVPDGPASYDIATTIVAVLVFSRWPPRVRSTIDGRPAIECGIAWTQPRHAFMEDGSILESGGSFIGSAIIEVIFGIFLLTQPKTYSEEIIEVSAKQAAARKKRGKPPLLEYRRLHVHINKEITHRKVDRTMGKDVDPDSDEAIQHRRYHKVMGHFRHYTNGKTVWIASHYRGDPALGVSFTEREVTR